MKARNDCLVDVLQRVLGTRLVPKKLDRLRMSPAVLSDLAVQVQEFYRAYEFPDKRQQELRPYFTGTWVGEPDFGHDLLFGPHHFTRLSQQ